MFNLAYSANVSPFNFNLAYSTNSFLTSFNSAYSSFGPGIIVLSSVTKETNKYTCTLDGVEIAMEKFYIFRRKQFLVTIIIELAEDLWDFVQTKIGKEVIINWQSETFNGEMANSLLQDVSFRQDYKRRIVKLHSFRNKREVAQHKFTLEKIEEKTFDINGNLQSVKCNPQPSISPEDTVTVDSIDYIVNNIKITADRFRTQMVVTFG